MLLVNLCQSPRTTSTPKKLITDCLEKPKLVGLVEAMGISGTIGYELICVSVAISKSDRGQTLVRDVSDANEWGAKKETR